MFNGVLLITPFNYSVPQMNGIQGFVFNYLTSDNGMSNKTFDEF